MFEYLCLAMLCADIMKYKHIIWTTEKNVKSFLNKLHNFDFQPDLVSERFLI